MLSLVGTRGDRGQEAGRPLAGDTGGACHWGGDTLADRVTKIRGHQPCHCGGKDTKPSDTGRPGLQGGEDTNIHRGGKSGDIDRGQTKYYQKRQGAKNATN